MFDIARKELHDRKTSLLIYCVTALLLTLLYVAVFPSVRQQAQSLNKLIATYPEALRKAFNLEGNAYSTLQSFLSVELFSLTWPLLAILLTVSRAGNAVAGEIERGTIGTILAQPLTRTKIYLGKYYSGLFSLGAFITFSILAPIPMAWLFRLTLPVKNMFFTALLCFVFGAAIFSLAMLTSAVATDRSKMYGMLGGLLFTMYMLNVVSGILPKLDKLKYASIFHYFTASEVMSHGHMAWSSLALFSGLTIATLLTGILMFNRRDISI